MLFINEGRGICMKHLVVKNFNHDCAIIVEWFQDKFLALNSEKCHILVSGHKEEVVIAKLVMH